MFEELSNQHNYPNVITSQFWWVGINKLKNNNDNNYNKSYKVFKNDEFIISNSSNGKL